MDRKRDGYTVMPFVIAMFVAVAGMPTNVYQICRRQVGTLEIEPWLTRALDSLGEVVGLSWFARLWRSRTAMASLALLLALMASQLGLADLSAHSVVGVAIVGEVAQPTLSEVKKAIDDSNQLFEGQFKAIALKIKALEDKGATVDPLLVEQREKLNKAMDGLSAINDTFINMQATVKRLETMGFQGDAEKVTEKTLAKFNGELKAAAMAGGRQFTPVDVAGLEAYNETFEKFLRKGANELTEAEKKAMSVGSDVNGGYLVSPDLTGKAVMRMFETSPMRNYASQQTISTDALEGTVDLEEASFGWVAELGTRSESNTPAVPAPWRISVHEAYSEPRISQKLAEDASSDPVAWLAKKVGDKFGRGYNTAFVTGTGVGKPRGFASYSTAATADGSRAWGVFEHVATGTNGSFGTDPNGVLKLLSLIHAMKDHFLANAGFYLNRTTLGGLRGITDASSAGKFIFIPSFQAGLPDTLMGYPVRKLQDMATYTTTDALALAFGDMAECYQIVDRLGLTTLVDPYTAKPWIKYYTRGRVGGDALNFEAMKFLKFGTS